MSVASRLLAAQRHRPYPLPERPWIMRQNWHDLLFAHWSVDAERLATLIPRPLALDLDANGRAWLGVVPFWMSGIRFRALPAAPGLSRFPELNLRTYVRFQDRPGVWFFSLDAQNRLAVETARRWFSLNYLYAYIKQGESNGRRTYDSRRVDRRGRPAALRVEYWPVGDGFHSAPGDLEHWLTERYCLYSADNRGRLFRGEIHHEPWLLQRAGADVAENSMTAGLDLALAGEPHLLYVRKIETIVWTPERVF